LTGRQFATFGLAVALRSLLSSSSASSSSFDKNPTNSNTAALILSVLPLLTKRAEDNLSPTRESAKFCLSLCAHTFGAKPLADLMKKKPFNESLKCLEYLEKLAEKPQLTLPLPPFKEKELTEKFNKQNGIASSSSSSSSSSTSSSSSGSTPAISKQKSLMQPTKSSAASLSFVSLLLPLCAFLVFFFSFLCFRNLL
jgi:thiazolylpeptide-type bacteriocin precursor